MKPIGTTECISFQSPNSGTLFFLNSRETLSNSQTVSRPLCMTLFSHLLMLPTVPLKKKEGNIQRKAIPEIAHFRSVYHVIVYTDRILQVEH